MSRLRESEKWCPRGCGKRISHLYNHKEGGGLVPVFKCSTCKRLYDRRDLS